MADPQNQNQGLQPGESLEQPGTQSTSLQPGESLEQPGQSTQNTPEQTDDNPQDMTHPFPKFVGDMGRGFMKTAAGSLAAAEDLGNKMTPDWMKIHGTPEQEQQAENVRQKIKGYSQRPLLNSAEVAGASIEGIAEFVLGDEALKGLSMAEKLGLAQKLADLADKHPLLSKIIGHGLSAVRQGAVAAAQQKFHGATTGEALKTGGEAAALGTGIGAATEAGLSGLKVLQGSRPTTLDIAGEKVPVSRPQFQDQSRTTKLLSHAATKEGADEFISKYTQPGAVKAGTANFRQSASDLIQDYRNVIGDDSPVSPKGMETIDGMSKTMQEEAQQSYKKLDQAAMDDISEVNEYNKEESANAKKEERQPRLKEIPQTFTEMQDEIGKAKRTLASDEGGAGVKEEALATINRMQKRISEFIDKHGNVLNHGEFDAANRLYSQGVDFDILSRWVRSATRGTEGTPSALKQVTTRFNKESLANIPSRFNNLRWNGEGSFEQLLGPEGMKNFNDIINILQNPYAGPETGTFTGAVAQAATKSNIVVDAAKALGRPVSWLADKLLFDPEAGQHFLKVVDFAKTSGQSIGSVLNKTGDKLESGSKNISQNIMQRMSELPSEETGEMEIPGTGRMGTIGKKKVTPSSVSDVVSNYNQSLGKPEVSDHKVSEDPRAKDIATAYESMSHSPNDPDVKKAYDSLKKETKDQYHALQKAGYRLEPTEKDPYTSYEDMKDDVRHNQRLKVWTGAQPPEDHPLSEIDPETGMTYNTIFRYVHDLMGHIAGDNDFSEAGEENAYQRHAQSYSHDAIPAMTTETKGQTSTFFHGKNAPSFPEQKANILPSDFYGSQEQGVINRIKSGKPFAVLQAENPQNSPLSPEENAKRTQLLLEDLKAKGYHPIEVGGNTKDVPGIKEHAFFVPDISPQDAAKFGKKYGQYGIFTHQGLHDLNTDLVNPVDRTKPLLTGDAARQQQYYTTVGGEDFHAPIDFSKSLKANSPELRAETLPPVAKENLTPEEIAGVAKSDARTKKFVNNLLSIPSVQEYTDIARLGEGARKWYSRSQTAFKAMMGEAPEYFKPEDEEKFLGVLAATSPQQAVSSNLKEALSFWKDWNDAGRPEFSIDKWKQFDDIADKSRRAARRGPTEKWNYAPNTPKWKAENIIIKNLTLPSTKVPNLIKSLSGENLWPDLSKNAAFKVPSFANNLKGWLNNVTNDSWMGLFGGIDKSALSSPENYHPLTVATREAAKALGWEPAEAQAAIWSFTQALTEAGEEDPDVIRAYSEDFKDLLANDKETRSILSDLGVNLDELDSKLQNIEEKPEVTAGSTPTTSDSVRKLKERIEEARGRGAIPPPKSAQGNLFDNPVKSRGVASILGGQR